MAKQASARALKRFRVAMVETVREHMPWPYEDVGRDSVEATEAAEAAVDKIIVWLWDEVQL